MAISIRVPDTCLAGLEYNFYMLGVPQVITISGRGLSKTDLDVINQSRIREFGSETLINPQPDNEDWKRLHFLVKSKGKLLSYGRLIEVEVTFMGRSFKILGIGSIASIIKRKGYGKLLVLAIKEHIKKTKKTGLGFCNKDTTEFYRQCGLGIMADGKKRFEPGSTRFPEGDAVYIPGDDQLIEKILQQPGEVAHLSRPQW